MLIISLFYVLMLISYQFFPSIFNSIASLHVNIEVLVLLA